MLRELKSSQLYYLDLYNEWGTTIRTSSVVHSFDKSNSDL